MPGPDLNGCLGGLIGEFLPPQVCYIVWSKSSIRGVHDSRDGAKRHERWLVANGKGDWLTYRITKARWFKDFDGSTWTKKLEYTNVD